MNDVLGVQKLDTFDELQQKIDTWNSLRAVKRLNSSVGPLALAAASNEYLELLGVGPEALQDLDEAGLKKLAAKQAAALLRRVLRRPGVCGRIMPQCASISWSTACIDGGGL